MAADPAAAWQLDFSGGEMAPADKTTALRVRLVRETK
jgi:hypothetical protein